MRPCGPSYYRRRRREDDTSIKKYYSPKKQKSIYFKLHSVFAKEMIIHTCLKNFSHGKKQTKNYYCDINSKYPSTLRPSLKTIGKKSFQLFQVSCSSTKRLYLSVILIPCCSSKKTLKTDPF